MNLVVITYPTAIENEAEIINQLFEEGLELLHLRKPDYKIEETENLLMNINRKFHSRIALHQHHEIASGFGIERLHFTETNRNLQKKGSLNTKTKTFSTSIHRLPDLENLDESFTYCFFGPVFNSISKPGYSSVITNDFILPVNRNIKIIAIGGIDETKISKAKKYHFDGVAVLGKIWGKSENAISNFKLLQSECRN